MTTTKPKTQAKQGYWWFGGASSGMAACCTHPLDLLKVHLQTQQTKEFGLLGMGKRVVANEGILGLYNGISASLLRQMTYSSARFGIYETYKTRNLGRDLPFYEKAAVSMSAGFFGGYCGNPGDMVNVRMQNDMKMAPENRRNYKHAIDGVIKVIRHEGVMTLFSGVTMTAVRAAFMTLGQLAFYDVFKEAMLKTGLFADNMITHFSAATGAASVATVLTQPFDVMKTRLMNAKPGTYSGLMACGLDIGKSGPLGFYRGMTPAFIRLGPQTILIFVFLEQLKQNFGYIPQQTS